MGDSPSTSFVTRGMVTNLWSVVRIIHSCCWELRVWFRVALETSKIAIIFRVSRKIKIAVCGHNSCSIVMSECVWSKEVSEKKYGNDDFFLCLKPGIVIFSNLLG